MRAIKKKGSWERKWKTWKRMEKGSPLLKCRNFLEMVITWNFNPHQRQPQFLIPTSQNSQNDGTPLAESPSDLLVKLLDVNLIKKIPFCQPDQTSKNFKAKPWCGYHSDVLGHHMNRCRVWSTRFRLLKKTACYKWRKPNNLSYAIFVSPLTFLNSYELLTLLRKIRRYHHELIA